ncbi:MAG: M3 family oligoendopeptidase [Candidatus Dormibacteraceae bacterium]
MSIASNETGAESVRWRLEELYASPDDPAIEQELKRAQQFAIDFEARYKGRLGELTAAQFVEMMEALGDHHKLSSRPAIFAHLMHTQNTQDHAAGWLIGRVREAAAERDRHLVFFELEMAALDDAQMAALFADPAVATYRHAVERERIYRPHQLTEVEEQLLTELSPTSTAAWTRLFAELCAAVQIDSGGEALPLPVALSRLRDPQRAVREEASHAITTGLERDLRTRSYIFNVLLQQKGISDRLRSYPSWISSRNLANETTDAAVKALVEAVSSRFDIVARYYRAKARILGLEKLYEWDRYAPIDTVSRSLTWTEARDLVQGAYNRFSPRAGGIIERFFSEPWIDAPITPNKEGGAYCAFATPDLHPFVMLNFTGELNDALTLAHELGHGLHDVLAGEANHIFDYHPPLTLAETASVFGETLTFDSIMAGEPDPKVRLTMLCHQVEGAFATVFRQVAMNLFEDALHRARRERGELAPEQIGEIWQEQIQRMFQDSLELTGEHRVWWSYVEHFVHTPGYVYAYAYGNLLALSIYRRYRELGDPAFTDAYLDFLAAGGSMPPHEAVMKVGMDINDPRFWEQGIAIIDSMVSEVERLSAP